MITRTLFIAFALFLILQITYAAPPSAVKCSGNNVECTVSGTYGTWPDRSICKAKKVVYPKNEEEIIAAVSEASKHKMKMKVVSKLSHSMTKLVCPGGDKGLVISTRDLIGIKVDKESKSVTVDPGVYLQDFVDEIAKYGFAFPASPYWNGLSMAGMLGTGAHGSSLWGKGSAVHEYVKTIRLVVPASQSQGYAKVLVLSEGDARFEAAKVSLGVLGVISKITFQVQPMFKRSVTNLKQSDDDLEDQIASFGLEHEFADVIWYASQHKAIYRVDNRVDASTEGDGVNNFLGFRKYNRLVAQADRTAENLYESAKDSAAKCAQAAIQSEIIGGHGSGMKNTEDDFVGYPVVGFQNKMQTTGSCHKAEHESDICVWDPRVDGLFFHQTTVSISVHKIRDFILDVKKLRHERPTTLCGIDMYYGFVMRYVKASSAFLGHSEDSVDVDITYYRSRDPKAPRLHQGVLEEIEQIAVFKYGGLPHWGKNRNVAFIGVAKKFPEMDQFLKIRAELDPQGLFSSEWSDAMLGMNTEGLTNSEDHCAMEGMCICSQHRHCAPQQHYYCEAGLVYPAARVCRHLDLLARNREEL